MKKILPKNGGAGGQKIWQLHPPPLTDNQNILVVLNQIPRVLLVVMADESEKLLYLRAVIVFYPPAVSEGILLSSIGHYATCSLHGGTWYCFDDLRKSAEIINGNRIYSVDLLPYSI